jgi:hypothetical protein
LHGFSSNMWINWYVGAWKASASKNPILILTYN